MNQKNEGFGNVSDGEEERIRDAILDKALKGRQPSDLMLRCSYPIVKSKISLTYFILGTILDSEGMSFFLVI
jgi:hypothetical protein